LTALRTATWGRYVEWGADRLARANVEKVKGSPSSEIKLKSLLLLLWTRIEAETQDVAFIVSFGMILVLQGRTSKREALSIIRPTKNKWTRSRCGSYVWHKGAHRRLTRDLNVWDIWRHGWWRRTPRMLWWQYNDSNRRIEAVAKIRIPWSDLSGRRSILRDRGQAICIYLLLRFMYLLEKIVPVGGGTILYVVLRKSAGGETRSSIDAVLPVAYRNGLGEGKLAHPTLHTVLEHVVVLATATGTGNIIKANIVPIYGTAHCTRI